MNIDIHDILELAAVEKPFPVVVGGEHVFSGRTGVPIVCERRCVDKECYSERRLGAFVCSKGVRYVSRRIADAQVTVFGLAPLDSRRKELSLKGRGFPAAMVESWFETLAGIAGAFDKQFMIGRTSALDAVHDISRMAVDVVNLANELVRKELQAGASIEDAPPSHLSILKAAELLSKEFERLELLVNPASAAVGKMYVHIYQLFHKYVIIGNLAQSRGRARRIIMKGRSDRTLHLYESISVLALALVENAAKYSFSGESVDVEVVDVTGGVAVSVRSIGPLIEPGEIQNVFNKGFRGKWAQKIGVDGRGLGLHLAKIVADAHGTRIALSSRSSGYERDGVPVAENEFGVRLASVV